MKIWIKLFIGIILGTILGIIIPSNIGSDFFESAANIAINIGRYAIFPLIFFSLIIGTYELKINHARFKTYGLMFLYMLAATLLLVIIGVLSVFILFQGRIEIVTDKMDSINVPGFKEVMLTSFSKNMFNALIEHGDFLLPVMIVALILGMNLTFDKVITRPVIQLVDSLSRIFYHINSFITEIFAVGLIFITASSVMTLKVIQNFTIYTQLVVILIIDIAIVLFGVFPGILYLLGEKRNPYKWLYAITGPLLTALTTGDSYISLSTLIKHGKENMGVPRRTGSITYPVFALFGKAGTALVVSVSFFIILKSISAADINILDVLWVIAFSFLVSFAVSSRPGDGVFIAIVLLCNASTKINQNQYLILKAIQPLLIGFGVILDVATSAFISFLIAHRDGVKLKIEARDFI
ncbi:MAG: dicarboxylate/amino acid:cation symporter [Spirochaetales bacterium]|nr:dicarboxylate/amino acid:cation symporter [Spirochaetales bacterium]